MSIESASCCRRASSVPTSCAESKGDGLIPGHSSPARGPGDQATDSRQLHPKIPAPAREAPFTETATEGTGEDQRLAPAPVLSGLHSRPLRTLPRMASSLREARPRHAGKPSLGHLTPLTPHPAARGLPAHPSHQSETGKESAAHLLVGTSLGLKRTAIPIGSERDSPAHHTPARIACARHLGELGERRRSLGGRARGGVAAVDAYQYGGRVQARQLVHRPQHRHRNDRRTAAPAVRAGLSNRPVFRLFCETKVT